MNNQWLIWSSEHGGWWGPNGCGYVKSMDGAGRYSYDEAMKICKDANCWIGRNSPPQETMIPVEALPQAEKAVA